MIKSADRALQILELIAKGREDSSMLRLPIHLKSLQAVYPDF